MAIMIDGPGIDSTDLHKVFSNQAKHEVQILATDFVEACYSNDIWDEFLIMPAKIQPLPFIDCFNELIESYAPSWGSQGLLFRYNPKESHNKIKPVPGHKTKMFNRKYFKKTPNNFRMS